MMAQRVRRLTKITQTLSRVSLEYGVQAPGRGPLHELSEPRSPASQKEAWGSEVPGRLEAAQLSHLLPGNEFNNSNTCHVLDRCRSKCLTYADLRDLQRDPHLTTEETDVQRVK